MKHTIAMSSVTLMATVHRGITNDPPRRQQEHSQRWSNAYLKIVHGPLTKEQPTWER